MFSDPSALSLFIDRLETRSSLSAEERDAILSLRGAAAQVGTNRDFVGLGEQVDHACLVVDGLVGRFSQTLDGHRQITALYIPGDMPDLHSVVLPQASSALQALTTTTILRVPHDALARVAARYPAIAQAFWRDCTVDAIVAAEWIANVGRRDARTRLAHLICEMEQRYARIGKVDGDSFDFPATQAHLADATGLTSVHVNRMFQTLRLEKIVSVHGRKITILDRPALERAADFDRGYLQLDIAPTRLAA